MEEAALGSRFRGNDELVRNWDRLRAVRAEVTEAIEPYRREKTIRSSLEAEVAVRTKDARLADLLAAKDIDELAELFIVSVAATTGFTDDAVDDVTQVTVTRTQNHKCGRCWRHLPEVTTDGALCNRCETVLGAG